jgi:hypothetical protein
MAYMAVEVHIYNTTTFRTDALQDMLRQRPVGAEPGIIAMAEGGYVPPGQVFDRGAMTLTTTFWPEEAR